MDGFIKKRCAGEAARIFILLGLLVLILVTCGIAAGCRNTGLREDPGEQETQVTQGSQEMPGESETAGAAGVPEEIVDLAEIEANEAGKVMILMYHVIGAPQEKPWMQTAANFRRDLETLYIEGYTLVRLTDFIENKFNVPAGRSPLILTFDDGTAGHFRYLEDADGKTSIDPDCAVGILLDFAREHPEFGHTATFFINDRPFGQPKYWQEKLRKLIELGFDLGNHTLTHPKLSQLSKESVEQELAGFIRIVRDVVPGYDVTSLALPYGLFPKEPAWAWEGESYKHTTVLKVGANPSLSPVTKGFDPLRLPRVQASSEELGKWIKYFQDNPGEKYISDGDLNTVAIPREKEELLNTEALQGRELLLW